LRWSERRPAPGGRLRMPPRIKILEAAGAIGDGRVRVWRALDGSLRAKVTSSDGSRSYDVILKRCGQSCYEAYSTDNGTSLRGYTGYPIIAVLMLEGAIPRDERVERALRGFPWREMNERLRKYDLVTEEAFRWAEKRGVERSTIESYMARAYNTLKGLTIKYSPPPGGAG